MILLDTHVWLWWLSGAGGLSTAASTAIDEAIDADGVTVSTISTWEIALLVDRERLTLRIPVGEWIEASEAVPSLSFVPPSNRIMLESVALPGQFHRDPTDRIIVATARMEGMSVVTKDTKIQDYPHVQSLW